MIQEKQHTNMDSTAPTCCLLQSRRRLKESGATQRSSPQVIKFTKMHGAGNDYIYVNTLLYNIPDPAKAAREWSKPHFGIGSDGLILIGEANKGLNGSKVSEGSKEFQKASETADFSMRIFNNDGSEAMMCGNGTRCVAKYLHDKGLTDKNPIRLQTLSGIKVLNLHLDDDDKVESVTVDMGEPELIHNAQCIMHNAGGQTINYEVNVEGRLFSGTFVSMGNPHFVIFLDEDVEQFPVEKYGPILEHHDMFPQRCNIEFAQILEDKVPGIGGQVPTIRMRVWERGSGITLACGTGACATAVAAKLTGRTNDESNIKMDGGTLNIKWDTNNHIMMTGPAAISFEGEISLPD